ncbi:hypothetical protein BACCIP111899_01311 [Bacillus rhizoplanae]|uniref:Uncharacterized protein n=1 Tax=Bacillus rhizoplanae TaxID=2880966 RepID=A0ABM8Y8S1_9BACI|nr:hypothetical protein [Bacillus rhizoplanae]CAG9612139.1 hypothetical protein BACCIP111899_01311 [Bacillus rhizoplanae]
MGMGISFISIALPILFCILNIQFLGYKLEKYISRKSTFVEYIYGASFLVCFILTLPILLIVSNSSVAYPIILAGVLVGGCGTIFYAILENQIVKCMIRLLDG